MATASNATSGNSSPGESSTVPQWKRDLIQRRRQQSKVLANSGASAKLCTAVVGSPVAAQDPISVISTTTATSSSVTTTINATATTDSPAPNSTVQEQHHHHHHSPIAAANTGPIPRAATTPPPGSSLRGSTCGALHGGTGPGTGEAVVAATASVVSVASVACNMRLEADLSLCSDSEDVANGVLSKSADMDSGSSSGSRKQQDYGNGSESEDSGQEASKRNDANSCEEAANRPAVCCRTSKVERDVLAELSKARSERIDAEMARNRSLNEDAESDSSEELQYGPGIVNKLKSKYLNLTLREMNKNRVSVQRFRRAASLEDLLDCDEESGEKVVRKYAKRNATGVAAAKTDRYRNASRGNDSMKRARSVETLVRYNTDETNGQGVLGRPASNGLRQEPVNDHIILVDRTVVKIESRLGGLGGLAELDRPKPVNKPKRIKPLLAETERPPPDLVKTTMRIFEGSAKKLKPKGEVAAKVATFKTINDTFKAQAQKKIAPKPPLQPKPFVNGNTRSTPGSPKKIILPQKPTAELIETQEGQEEYHIDGVITEPIVQSVSSVVSKFQQFEKSQSPSPSPEPSAFKLKFSPAPSPEPTQNKQQPRVVSLEISVKSPPVTPVLSPRITSPRVQNPSSPMKDLTLRGQVPSKLPSPPSPMKEVLRQNSSPVHKPPLSPSRELFHQISSPETGKIPWPPEKEPAKLTVEVSRQQITERVANSENNEKKDIVKLDKDDPPNEIIEAAEDVDGPKSISKSALENISKAGITMQFSFNDKPALNKSYLPGVKQNGEKSMDEQTESRCSSGTKPSTESRGKSFLPGAPVSDSNTVTEPEAVSRLLQERLEPEKYDRKIEDAKDDTEVKPIVVADTKPIGAICSLGLIKSSMTTSYSQGNESKIVRCQKSESSPPQKQIGIIRPLVSTKTQHPQQNLSNRELEKNLINRVKSIEQPTKVVVSLKSAEEIQPNKKSAGSGGGLWDTSPWNQQNNTMVFNFSNRKDVPDYIENDGLIIKRKREKPKVGDSGIIVLDATLDASTTDDAEWEISGGPPSPCDVSFLNDNVLINGRSNLSRTPRNHKHRIQFDDTATRTFEYPSENSMLEGESSSVDGEIAGSGEQLCTVNNKTVSNPTTVPTLLGGGGGLASYTPSKVDLASEGFELGITRAVSSSTSTTNEVPGATKTTTNVAQSENENEVDYLKPAQDAGAWGSETTGDLLY